MTNINWQNPTAFFLFLLLGLIIVVYFLAQKSRRPTLQISEINLFRSLPQTWRTRLSHLPFLLRGLGVVFFILSLARPQTSDIKTNRTVDGIDILIALDVSDSMLIEDMKPLNRLESAKEVIKEFIQKRKNDRIGLVIFAGESFTLVPLTLDGELILGRLKEITTAQEARIKDGTAIGVALANAAGRLKDSQAKSRVIVFLTDGENNSGTIDPSTALELAKGYGLKIYSIGIGRDGPTRIPIYQRDLFGNKIKTYQPFESSVNEELLSEMAKQTGGKYFRATREDSLGAVFDEIDSLEKTKVEVNQYTKMNEVYQSLLLAGLIFYILGTVLARSVWLRVVAP